MTSLSFIFWGFAARFWAFSQELPPVLEGHRSLYIHPSNIYAVSKGRTNVSRVAARIPSAPSSQPCAHIGLAPLEPGIVTDAKSAIKWMEYSLMGLASVVSPTATYQEILQGGEDVLKEQQQMTAKVT